MNIPRVSPVGIVEQPPGYRSRVRRYPASIRVAAMLVLGAFLLVAVTTTVVSLGAYCLTSYAGLIAR